MSTLSRTCAYHQAAPAVAICTECMSDVCVACHGTDLRGYCICSACREKFAPPRTAWENTDTDYSPRAFLATLAEAIKSPRTFFMRIKPFGSVWPAVSFGLIAMGLGLLFSNTWKLVFFDTFGQSLAKMAEEMGVGLQMVKAAMFLAIPVQMALGFLLHLLVLNTAIRLAGGRTRWGLTARIVGYASAAYIFMLIPPIADFMLGHFLAIIWMFNLEMGALALFFRLGPWKTLAVAMATLMLILPFAF